MKYNTFVRITEKYYNLLKEKIYYLVVRSDFL